MRFLLLSLCLLGFALNPLHADPRNDMAIMAHAPSIKLGIGDRPGVLFVTLHNKSSATRLVARSCSSAAVTAGVCGARDARSGR